MKLLEVQNNVRLGECEVWINKRERPPKGGLCSLYPEWESNPHAARTHDFESCASTSSAIQAFFYGVRIYVVFLNAPNTSTWTTERDAEWM